MATLALAFPHPEAVSVGGRTLRAVCFQLRDLARLEALARSLVPHPLAGRRGPLAAAKAAARGDYLGDSAESRAYAELLREARRACDSWGGTAADRLLATGPGAALWLEALLARTNPGFGLVEAAGLLPGLTVEELRHLQAIAYAAHPLDELMRGADPRPPGAEVDDWGGAIVRLMDRYPAYTLEEVGALYLSQWVLLSSGGKAEPGRPREPVGWARRVKARWRALMGVGAGSNGQVH